MVSKWGKFYKCSIALLCSLVLSFVFVGKSAEAATSTVGFASGYGNGSFWVGIEDFTSYPESIELWEQVDPATENSSYTYPGGLNLYLRFTNDAGASSSYTGGYLNGTCTFTLVCNVTNSQAVTSIPFVALYNGVQTESVSCAMVYKSGNSLQFCVTFANYSLEPQGGSNRRSIYLGNLDITAQAKRTADGSQAQLTCTTSWASVATDVRCTAMADAGTSIAGQLYAAIENSTSVSDIVAYLSAIEDSNGDINVAVSHINEYLIPQVIQHLISIGTNTANIKINTDELVRLLTAFYNTWPAYSSQVLFYLEQLVNMNAEQSSIADKVQQEYSNKASQSASEAAGMQAVLPQVDQSDFDIGSQLDSGTVTTLSAFWAMFPNNALIGTMFAIAIAGIAAGYFLYGKKS